MFILSLWITVLVRAHKYSIQITYLKELFAPACSNLVPEYAQIVSSLQSSVEWTRAGFELTFSAFVVFKS